MRTIDEVRARFKELDEHKKDPNKGIEDFLGFQRESLMQFLPECWELEGRRDQCPALTEDNVRSALVDYLGFAFSKAINHRGISANRSVDKLKTWAWVLGRNDLVEFADDKSNYQNYGVPVLKRFAQAFDVAPPDFIKNWPDGGPCEPGCEQGCGG